MDHFNIPKTETSDNGKEYKLQLNKRLEKFKNQRNFGHLYQKLQAIKFLGNAGSHVQSVTKEDLLDAYEIIEYVLEECFQRPERVQSIINKSKSLENKYKL